MKKIDFERDLKKINAKKAAAEVLLWLTRHVEQYVDNHEYSYSLTLNVRDDSMPHLRKIMLLFHDVFGIPEDRLAVLDSIRTPEEAEKIRKAYGELTSGGRTSVEEAKLVHLFLQEAAGEDQDSSGERSDQEAALLPKLYNLVDRVKVEMEKNTKLLDDLIRRLVYFYELSGFREGKALEVTLDGSLEFRLFEYHSELTIVEARKKVPDNEGGYKFADDGHYAIGMPGGFMLEFDLKTWPRSEQTSMF